MCGHVGMAGELNGTHDKVLKMLLILDSLRGEDSTGVAFVSRFTGNVTVAKAVGDPFVLFNDNKYGKGIAGQNRVMIGHNRYATSGGVSKTGAHPFEFDTLVGAHNGTLQSKWRLDDEKDYKVDSQALYHNIEKNGLKETISRLPGVGNSWSLVWWDKEDQTLNFLRNKERTMFMCRSEDGKVLFWASESWMLAAALGKANIKHGDIFPTEENVHYSVYVDNKGAMHKPKTVMVEPPEQVYLPQQHNGRPPFIPNNTKTTQNAPAVKQQSNVVELKSSNTPAVSEVAQGKKLDLLGNNGSGNGLASDPSYINSKGRTLEILCERVDGNGGKYLCLFDPLEPCVDIRLYPCKQDEDLFNCLSDDIIGDITSYDMTDKAALRPYYKVSPWTIKRILPEAEINKKLQEELAAALAEADDELDTLPDHRGHLITIKEWKKQYTVCGWCNDHLDPFKSNRYTTAGDCLCPGCAKDEQVTQYVNII